ncbi:hypothetical protein Q5H93_16340 [Hymenobacter sp. ASUV-10]|uniref:WD40 repeat domain-containing protein n=1 Tax=Hymenobacter aranciens TaxID=3063996 RepID=A0ABT9BDH2_9BACT|nr:hypothetical protein [Hymenobacter sp. ASUV-10]MDO7876315.1 hypothetical protein [Hymenobacter sp. ASUV-10]
MSSLSHRLTDPHSANSVTITLAGASLTVATGRPGKERTTTKTFGTPAEARQQFEKREWEALKKGFVLHQPTSPAGEPHLHYYLGKGYTGCLSFVGTPTGIYVYQNGWDNTSAQPVDYLLRLDAAGTLLATIALPKILPWDLHYNAPANRLLLDVDHFIYDYDLATGQFRQLAAPGSGPGIHWTSFVAVSATVQAFAAEPTLHLQTLAGQPLVEIPYRTDLVNGSSVFAAALSKSGQQLALHTRFGEIQLLDTADGRLQSTITGNFTRIARLEFAANDTMLVVHAPWERGPLLFFEVATGRALAFPSLALPDNPQDFCFNSDESRLVVLHRDTAWVYDFTGKKLLRSFHLYHTVKRAQARFVGDALGVRTDYGCFSLYAV